MADVTTTQRPCLARQHCHRCGEETATVYLRLSSGHVGNCCAACHATRKGHPFVSRRLYAISTLPMPARAEGVNNADAKTAI